MTDAASTGSDAEGGAPGVRAVVFDLDGPLLDTMASVPSAYVETIRALGGPGLTTAQLIGAWHLGPTPVVLAHFLGRLATPGDLECFDDHVAAASEHPYTAYRPADVITALASAGPGWTPP
ncbi:HAD family hydrolase [Actinomadura formosensis]|uniref:HAD family hydrolase n=1 Tax=Actinomadura formosensis TaxID=60706 RepID=UPI0008305E8C|nr:hypothetical protein [Actinomadura formosensis]